MAKSKGFHDTVFTQEQAHAITSLALIGSEVSEALDVYRRDGHHRSDDFGFELADIQIRLLDLAGKLDIDLGHFVITKMEKNAGRPKLHGKAF
jgi:NTP pyrophosphatase (non-canonical NTP hydrolase)